MKPTLNDLFDLLQQAEEMAFYLMAQEPDRFKKGHRKVIDEKIRAALQEIAGVIQKESAQ